MKLGDHVTYKDEVGEGIITQVNKHLYFVEEDSGFGDWYNKDELILVIDQVYSAPSLAEIRSKENTKKGASKPHSKNHTSRLEVDLHLHVFMENTRNLTNHDKVQAQLLEAKKALGKAKGQKYKFLHLIHGKGSGKLRQELHQWLSHQNVVDFYDIDISGNRSGVTEVQLF